MPDMPAPPTPEKPLVPEANEPPDMLGGGDAVSERPPAAPERKPEQQAEKKSELVYQKILAQVVQPAPAVAAAADEAAAEIDARSITALTDAGEQVDKLIQFALEKGLPHAVAVARKLDFYVMDEMQGRMANEFYDALVAKGMITKE